MTTITNFTGLSIGSSTDHLGIDGDGYVTLSGSSRVDRELRITAISTEPGASAPFKTLRDVGASGGVKVPVLQFSQTLQNDCYFEVHYPDGIDGTVGVEFHVMWFPGASWTSGNYLWKFEYIVTAESGVALNAGTPVTISANVTPTAATDMIETEFATPIIGFGDDYILLCHFYRDVAGDNGNDVGEIRWFEVKYTANTFGSKHV